MLAKILKNGQQLFYTFRWLVQFSVGRHLCIVRYLVLLYLQHTNFEGGLMELSAGGWLICVKMFVEQISCIVFDLEVWDPVDSKCY